MHAYDAFKSSTISTFLEELAARFEKDPVILPPLDVLAGAELRRVTGD